MMPRPGTVVSQVDHLELLAKHLSLQEGKGGEVTEQHKMLAKQYMEAQAQ